MAEFVAVDTGHLIQAKKRFRNRVADLRVGHHLVTSRRRCGSLRVRQGGLFGLTDVREAGFEDIEAFVELLVGDNQWD